MRRYSVTGFRQGDHVCGLYETADEQVTVAARFIADGLRRAERCAYAADGSETLAAFRARLEKHGIDVLYEEGRRSLVLVTRDDGWFIGGRFDPERVIRMLNEGLERALDEGYTGFRACGDMSWLNGGAITATQILDYESRCTDFFRSVRGLCLCLYDRRRASAGVLHAALAAHPSVFLDGRHLSNPFHGETASGAAHDVSAAAFDRKVARLHADDLSA